MTVKKSTFLIIGLVISVVGLGVIGYSTIEGWSFFDALYMTIITLTTTGYQEVHSLSSTGRVFTIVLLIVGMGTVAYSASHVIQDLLTINFKSQRRRRMEKNLNKLSGHTIVCGFGRMGRVTCQELARENADFVVIDKNPQAVHELEKTHYHWLEGDATQDDVLIQAGIERARALVCMVDNDADSLYISLAGRTLNKQTFIISRATEESARSKILRAGADRVILPIVLSGLSVAQSVLNPSFEDFLDITGVDFQNNQRVQLAEIPIKEGSKFVNQSLSDCDLQKKGVVVVGVRNPKGSFHFSPPPDYRLLTGDVIVSLSTPDNYENIMDQI